MRARSPTRSRSVTLLPQAGEVRNADAEAVPYLLMEEILERCKMHNYERLFLTKYSFKPLTHTYFAVASGNPTEQFHYFTSICAWLMSLQGTTWRAPSQMDDPNSSVNALYSQLQQIGAPTNYPPQKLKQGFGEHCCAVLKHLLDQLPLEFKKATYTEELEYEEAAVDEDAVEVDELTDEVGAADVEEDEYFGGGGPADAGGGDQAKLNDSILDATVDPADWQIELERVTPQLKLQILSDPKEWRNRLVNTKSHQQVRRRRRREDPAALWPTAVADRRGRPPPPPLERERAPASRPGHAPRVPRAHRPFPCWRARADCRLARAGDVFYARAAERGYGSDAAGRAQERAEAQSRVQGPGGRLRHQAGPAAGGAGRV